MSNCDGDVFVYLLIDNGLLHEVSASYIDADSNGCPAWLAPIYAGPAVAVSPFLVDLEAAYEAGDLDRVMGYLNARTPALHVSIVETTLGLEQIAQHLRRFIFILDPQGKQFTFRYADCAVLAQLPALLTAVQWATMSGPIIRWGIHDRSGSVVQLPTVEPVANSPTPFSLDHEQLAALDEASEADHCIAKVKMMRHGADLPGNAAQQHAWAQSARQAWRVAGNSNALILMFLVEAALVTRGDILGRYDIPDLLAMNEASAFRSRLRELAMEIQIRRNNAQLMNSDKSNIDVFLI